MGTKNKFYNIENKENGIYNYIEENYFNLDMFFESVSLMGHYTYMGDLTTNKWYLSNSMKELLGYQNNVEEDCLPRWRSIIATENDLKIYDEAFQKRFLEKRDKYDLVYRIKKPNGNITWVRAITLLQWNEDKSKPLFFTGTIMELENTLNVCPIMSFAKEDVLKKELELVEHRDDLSFLVFRLNGFTEINENNGRQIADLLLREISDQLFASFSEEVKFFRLDGLRFVLILYRKQDLQQLAQQIKDIIEAIYLKYELILTKPCVVGILDSYEATITNEELIKDIMNLSEAIKQDESSEKIFYSSSILSQHKLKCSLDANLVKDVYNNFENFRIVLQPIVSTKDKSIIGAEVLLRWNYQGKPISPFQFIPELEKNGLIANVGRFVFEETLKALVKITKTIPDFVIHFNVSYKQLEDKEFTKFMKEKIAEYKINSQQIVMELTETNYNHTPIELECFMKNVKDLNLQIALDDFGSGYSSIELLLKYPSDIIKLDKSIVQRITTPKDNLTMISSKEFIFNIVQTCHNFGKQLCAEGVELKEEFDLIKETNCDFIQGYYFYKPMELSDFYQKIKIQ